MRGGGNLQRCGLKKKMLGLLNKRREQGVVGEEVAGGESSGGGSRRARGC